MGSRFGGGLNALDDLVVAGAAAQVAHHPVLDLLGGGVWDFLEQSRRGDDLAGRADAALEAAVADERVLQRGQVLLVGRQTFDGGDGACRRR